MMTFPLGVASICDPLTSGYGPSLWQAPCAAATTPITITAKTWMTVAGYSSAAFQPALRVVPNRQLPTLSPTLSRKTSTTGKPIKFCTPTGCIDDALTDPVLTQNLLPIAGHIRRYVRHFSGYTVTAD